jgi:hypothetical protein
VPGGSGCRSATAPQPTTSAGPAGSTEDAVGGEVHTQQPGLDDGQWNRLSVDGDGDLVGVQGPHALAQLSLVGPEERRGFDGTALDGEGRDEDFDTD